MDGLLKFYEDNHNLGILTTLKRKTMSQFELEVEIKKISTEKSTKAVSWAELRKTCLDIMDSLSILPRVVINLIIDYCAPIQWNPKPLKVWHIPWGNARPLGVISDGKHLFVSDFTLNCVLKYSLDGSKVIAWEPKREESLPIFSSPSGLDIIQDHLFVIDKLRIQQFDLKDDRILSSWALQDFVSAYSCALKVDGPNVYVTLAGRHHIYIYNLLGLSLRYFGKKGHGTGEFNEPRGLALDETFLYICDGDNQRIQVLRKDNGDFSHQWGKRGEADGEFQDPYSILLSENLLYVGDLHRIQTFTLYGGFVQSLGQTLTSREAFCQVSSLCVVHGHLYATNANSRIHMFRMKG